MKPLLRMDAVEDDDDDVDCGGWLKRLWLDRRALAAMDLSPCFHLR